MPAPREAKPEAAPALSRMMQMKTDLNEKGVFESGDIPQECVKEAPKQLTGSDASIVPKLELGAAVIDSTDSDSDESSEDHSPRLTETGK